ncbi:MAG: 1-(5-phosphoribosyl)-5-[(5-phosphoribosylamino)methylideneamino]imidazole-4-carboxamide isomerase [Deltaproteobacteria bacterium]|nr:1-(5-phosphoribosyl)-5-[(5-phosphoribosylamino)methylideneamino]imidazole-4-carboxamide isomerase [Deltaproteobacteria bacterium]
MIVIPAIDIKNGKCVRLMQGEMDRETVFSDDPAQMARRWANEGAELIHVVDLDGAVEKKPKNLDVIRRVIEAAKVPVQIGGGIRDIETVRMYIKAGVERVVIGTQAVKDPELVVNACAGFPGRIIVGIDARAGRVAIDGWTETTGISAVELAGRFEGIGLCAINFTDIERDGMRTGPNIEATREFAMSVNIPVVASGGVSSMDDIKDLAPLESVGVCGVITGRALYDNTLDLAEAIGFLKKTGIS